MVTANEVRRNIVQRSSLEKANREIYVKDTRDTENGYDTPQGKPYAFFVPSTVKSTLGSPVSAIPAFS